MEYVTPIDEVRRREVVERTREYVRLGARHLRREFDCPEVLFDLRGRASGMYRVRRGERQIRYNPWLFAKYYEDCLATTVPHEVAHYLTDRVHGLRRIRPHGREWRALMEVFGADASVTADYSLEGIPVRRTTTYPYRCACDLHRLGARRHKRAQRREVRYHCVRCGVALEPVV